VGTTLRTCREAAGVSLSDVCDRTGVPWQKLEALETGDLTCFPDRRSALAAVRRYADLMDLQAGPLVQTVESQWPSVVSVAVPSDGSSGGTTSRGLLEADSTQLSRYPGDGSHLRAFTQTAQVPSVGGTRGYASNGHGANSSFAVTGVFRAHPRPPAYVRPAPLALRLAVWSVVALLAVCLAGLAAAHLDKQWLVDLRLVRGPTPPGTVSGAMSPPPSSPHRPAATVSSTQTNPGSISVSVRASSYAVVVTAIQPCWVWVTTPQSIPPVFGATLLAGQSHSFNSANGQLSVQLGASQVTVQVKIAGRIVPGWTLRPSSAPSVLTFASLTNS
jgi:hypothetical protein